MLLPFRDRAQAGRLLAEALRAYRDRRPLVLALPRGGVPVAFEIAMALDAPLDIVLVRKIGVPFQPELALGAVADGDEPDLFVDERLREGLGIDEGYVRRERARQVAEIGRRRLLYAGARPMLPVAGRTVILVDDGIATGATMLVAIRAMRRRQAAAILLAVPVAPEATIGRLREEVDAVACLAMPADFAAIGYFYEDFSQVDDATVIALLKARRGAMAKSAGTAEPPLPVR